MLGFGSHHLFDSTSMEMASSTIRDLRPFLRRRDLLPGVNGGVVRFKFYRYGLSDLASPDRFWNFSHGCREEDYPRNICSGCYVLDNGDSYSRLSINVDHAVRFIVPEILVLVLLPMLHDYFNGCVRARSLGTAAQIKIMGEPSLVFTDDDIFEHIASILVNISKVEAGRRILMEPKRGLLKQIIRQFDSTNQLRKKGVAGTIRNCCFEADTQIQNLLSVAEYLWPALLLPVAGKKIYSEGDRSKMPLELANALSHEREAVDDSEIRERALEAIYMIVMQDDGRKAFWSVNGPRILEVGYEDEEDLKVIGAYELIGSLLVGKGEIDEGQEQVEEKPQ